MTETTENKTSTFDRRSLAGLGYLAADGALFAYGAMSYLNPKVPEDKTAGKGMMITGAGWGIGGAVLARYGKQAVPMQLDRLEKKLYAFLKEEGATLDPEKLMKASEHEKRGFGQKIEEFLYDYPTEVLNAYYGVAALGMLWSGFVKGDKGEMGAAACVIAGAISAIFIREKSPHELTAEGKPAGIVAQGIQKVQKQPLGLASTIFMINNYGSYKSARQEHKASQDPQSPLYQDKKYLFKYGLAATYVASNLALGSGSKKAGGTPEERAAGQNAIIESAALVLAGESPAKQHYLAERLGEYLVKQRELRMEDHDPKELAAEITQAMRRQIVEASKQQDSKGFQAKLAEQAMSSEGFSRS